MGMRAFGLLFAVVLVGLAGCDDKGTGAAPVGSSPLTAQQELANEKCKQSEHCKEYGWCTAKDGYCVAGKDEDCKPTERCKEYGRCTAKDGKCVAGKDEDCKPTAWCKGNGLCTAKDGNCVK